MTPRSLPLIIVLGLFAVSCGSSSTPPAAVSTPVAEVTATPEPAAGEPTPIPAPTSAPVATDTDPPPFEDALTWFVGLLNSDDDPTIAELESRFSPAFLAEIPAEILIATVPELVRGAEPPFVITETTTLDGDVGLEAQARIESSNGLGFEVTIAVAAADPHLIAGVFVRPALELVPFASIEDIRTELAALAADSALGVYDVTDGACAVVDGFRTDLPMPVGSAFKLWILAELAEQISLGSASWDEPLAVADAHRSSPDGEVFAQPTGAELTLREHAELMISISDNSATDHLLARLGRENVEAAMTRIGIADPGRNMPMLSTGALFELKFIAAAPNAADYRALDLAGRVAMVDALEEAVLPWVAGVDAVEPVNADGVPIDQPRDLDLEWFASPDDLCLTHLHLTEIAEIPGLEPVADILEINPGAGIPFDRDRFPTIRFKGGSEPGVLAGAWWFERDDGRQFVVAGMAADDATAFSEVEAVLALASAIALVS